ncbi:MAG: hypothetical protein KME17_06670 [Cyanosarcina radialis HA8281-LM2]|jgi:hypothetical protein|nr:hypothetical protein [Cyanosarcina radialis HA8281-LM2]
MSNRISSEDLARLKEQLKPLIGQRFRSLSLPVVGKAKKDTTPQTTEVSS